jgi:hypothetical protein
VPTASRERGSPPPVGHVTATLWQSATRGLVRARLRSVLNSALPARRRLDALSASAHRAGC